MTTEIVADLHGLLAARRVVRGTIDAMAATLRLGITTAELDVITLDDLARPVARSAPRLEAGYPRAICISVNVGAGHGLPGARWLCPGNLVTSTWPPS